MYFIHTLIIYMFYLQPASMAFLNSTIHDKGAEIQCPLGLFGVYHRGK